MEVRAALGVYRKFKCEVGTIKASPPTDTDIPELAQAMRGVILTAVTNKGVDLTPFNQYFMGHNVDYERWLTEGMCRGLAIKYLACVKNGEEFNKVVNTD
jgi:hypothetical protein